MTAISINSFTGLVPRQPDHLLPDNAASYSDDCDFSRGRLQALKGGLQVLYPGGTVSSIYTEEGQFWYTWPFETTAHKSPVIGEKYQRIYYIEYIGGVRSLVVAPSPANTSTNGGPPPLGTKWLVGVPNPDKAPTLTLVDRTTLADYPNATIEFKTWYTDGSANFGVTTTAATVNTPWRKYTLAPILKPTDAPEGAVLVVQAIASEGTKQLFSMNTATNSTAGARSSALPGGVTMTLEVSASNNIVNFEWGVIETRAYIYTEQNTWDEEGGPSPVSLISPTYLQDVQVVVTHPNWEPLGPNKGAYRPYKQTNVYRTYGGPQYIKAGKTGGAGSATFVDSARTVSSQTADAGTALQSLTWVPPISWLFGLVLAPNGWFAAFRDNILYMSEPYRPHTWQYTITFAKDIVGICVGPQSIVVTTKEATFIVSGPHPASVTSMMLPVPMGGVSHKSMCMVEGGVAFLSNDGVVVVEGSQASLELSHKYFTRDTWRTQFGPHLGAMAVAYHDGCLVAVSNANPCGFIIDMDEADGAMTRFNYTLDALLRLPFLDTLYYSEVASGKVFRFREGDPLMANWASKQFITPRYTKFGIFFARMSGTGKVTIYAYKDGEETIFFTRYFDPVATKTVYQRMPPSPGHTKWQFRVILENGAVLEELAFAHSPDELKNV
jgi:hypothetical protein